MFISPPWFWRFLGLGTSAIAALPFLLTAQPSQAQSPQYTTFLEWCQARKTLKRGAKDTVEAILKTQSTTNCQTANDKLARSFGLNLNNRNLQDLRPLASLGQLRQLNLYGNQIKDLTPLASLKNLDRLILGQNQITNLKPLGNLGQLTQLFLSSNQIKDLTPLSSLTNLRILLLNRNQISDLKPLSSLTNLTELS
ncbi:MAG: leucine-rich repeat domain-containing protein, partial [Microcystaceae cyanobacterium]